MNNTLIPHLKYRVRTVAARRHWLLNLLYSRLEKHRHLLLRDNTQLVLEGYPRSGNSFALRAFQQVNPGVPVAHHMHAQSQVIEAVERGLPAIVLVREPSGAVPSLVIRHPHIGLRMALLSYAQFHEDIHPYRHGFVLAHFENVTRDFGAVINAANRKFGTSFASFDHSQGNVERIFSQMDEANAKFYGAFKTTHVPRPVAERSEKKQAIDLSEEPEMLRRAQHAYEALFAA
ncbi:MAG: hypothetical protein WC809_02295 [Sinimarinibacterium sp.]|jgi:hypothetical protein